MIMANVLISAGAVILSCPLTMTLNSIQLRGQTLEKASMKAFISVDQTPSQIFIDADRIEEDSFKPDKLWINYSPFGVLYDPAMGKN